MKELFTSTKKLLSFTVLLLMICCRQAALAQGQAVTGNITDAGGAPLPGVTVSVKGTTKAIATDSKGSFQLQLQPGENTLTAAMIGFTSQDVTVTPGQAVNITLLEAVS